MPLVGDKSVFAIEWEETRRTETRVYGHFCLWVSGRRIGDYEDTISLGVPIGFLESFLSHAGGRWLDILEGKSKEGVFAFVHGTVFGQGDETPERLRHDYSFHSRLRTIFHLDDIGQETFDDVEMILLDDRPSGMQRLIWRSPRDAPLQEIYLPNHVFDDVARQFLAACVMPVTLSDLFGLSGCAPIEFDGRTVHRKYSRQVRGWTVVHVRRLRHNPSVPQGLRINSGKVELEMDGRRARDIVLWADSEPEECALKVIGPQGAVLRMWNVWKEGGRPYIQGPSDNAGMMIDETLGGVTLSCSDGVGKTDFEDFVARLDFSQGSPQ